MKETAEMSEITPQMVKELRELTGVGFAKCKEALVEVNGDVQKAVDYLRKKGMASAQKKEGRETKEGSVATVETKDVIAVLEANAETDFVVKNEKFQLFLNDICEHAAKIQPSSVEELLNHTYEKDSSLTIDQYRNMVIQALGENIQLGRLLIIPKEKDRSFGIYSHMGGKIVAIAELSGSDDQQDLARGIAMHIAAEAPDYLDMEDVPESVKEREMEIARSQIKGNKPDEIVEKILTGKLQAFCDQFCLLSQKYVRDTSMTVKQVIDRQGQELKKPLKLKRFWRWTVGE